MMLKGYKGFWIRKALWKWKECVAVLMNGSKRVKDGGQASANKGFMSTLAFGALMLNHLARNVGLIKKVPLFVQSLKGRCLASTGSYSFNGSHCVFHGFKKEKTRKGHTAAYKGRTQPQHFRHADTNLADPKERPFRLTSWLLHPQPILWLPGKINPAEDITSGNDVCKGQFTLSAWPSS
eukprot:scaffold237029_cov19-Tisochrysis_lutea.AAC.1